MLKDFIDFNPRETLPKGQLAKKVAMEKLRPFCRDIEEFEVAKYSGGAKFRNGDTLLARITPCLENGKTAQVRFLNDGEVGFGSTEYIVLRAKEGVSDSDYIYYLSTSPKFREIAIQSMVGSSGRQRVQQDVLEKAELHIPPLDEQRKIAGILSALDDKIELNNKINRNLEAQAQAIFKSWFIDFEPFKNGKFIDSELGKIPEGWVCKKLKDFVEIKRGSSPRPIQDYLSGSGYNWLKISDATSESSPFIFNIKEHIKKSGISQTVYLVAGELVLSNSATPGIPKFLDVNTCIHDGWLWFSNSKLSYEFLYLFFLHKRRDFISLGNGSVFTNLKTDIVKDALFVYPNKAVMDEFDKITKTIFENIKIRSRESQRLTQLRDALLPKLMSGEIDVTDIAV